MTRKKSRPTHRETATKPSNEVGLYKMFWNSMETGPNSPQGVNPASVIIINDSPPDSPCGGQLDENIVVPGPIKEEMNEDAEEDSRENGKPMEEVSQRNSQTNQPGPLEENQVCELPPEDLVGTCEKIPYTPNQNTIISESSISPTVPASPLHGVTSEPLMESTGDPDVYDDAMSDMPDVGRTLSLLQSLLNAPEEDLEAMSLPALLGNHNVDDQMDVSENGGQEVLVDTGDTEPEIPSDTDKTDEPHQIEMTVDDDFPTSSNFLGKKIKLDSIGVSRAVNLLKERVRALYKEYLNDDVLLRTVAEPAEVDETPTSPPINVYPICCVKMERLPEPIAQKHTVAMSDDIFKTWKKQITRQRNEDKFRHLKVWRRGRMRLWRECQLDGMDQATYDEQVAYVIKHKVSENSTTDESDEESEHSNDSEESCSDLENEDSEGSSGDLSPTRLSSQPDISEADQLPGEYVVENQSTEMSRSKVSSALKITIRKASTRSEEEDKEEEHFSVPTFPPVQKSRKIATKRTFRRPSDPTLKTPKSTDPKKPKPPEEDLYDQSLLGTRSHEVENFNLLEKWDIPFEEPTLFRSPRAASRLAQIKTKEAFSTAKRNTTKTPVCAISKEVKEVVEMLCAKTVEAILCPVSASPKSIEDYKEPAKLSEPKYLPIEEPIFDESSELSHSELSMIEASSDFGGSTTSLASEDPAPPKKSPLKNRRRRRGGPGWAKKKKAVKSTTADEKSRENELLEDGKLPETVSQDKTPKSVSPAHSTQVPVVSEGPGQSPCRSEDDSGIRVERSDKLNQAPTDNLPTDVKLQKNSPIKTAQQVPPRLTRSKLPTIELEPGLLENFGSRKRKPKTEVLGELKEDAKKPKQVDKIKGKSQNETDVDDSNTQVPEVTEGPGEVVDEFKVDQEPARMLRSRSRGPPAKSAQHTDKPEPKVDKIDTLQLESPQSPSPETSEPSRVTRSKKRRSGPRSAYVIVRTTESPLPSVCAIVDSIAGHKLPLDKLFEVPVSGLPSAPISSSEEQTSKVDSAEETIKSYGENAEPVSSLHNELEPAEVEPVQNSGPNLDKELTQSAGLQECIQPPVLSCDQGLIQPQAAIQSLQPPTPPSSAQSGYHDLIQPSAGLDKELIQPAGDKELIQPAGDKELIHPAGDEELIQPAGDKELILPAGDKELIQPSVLQSVEPFVVPSLQEPNQLAATVLNKDLNQPMEYPDKATQSPEETKLGGSRLEEPQSSPTQAVDPETAPGDPAISNSAGTPENKAKEVLVALEKMSTPTTQPPISNAIDTTPPNPSLIPSSDINNILPGTFLNSLFNGTLDANLMNESLVDDPGDLVIDESDANEPDLNFWENLGNVEFSDDENNTDLADKIDKIIKDQIHQDPVPVPSLNSKETDNKEAPSKPGKGEPMSRRDSIDERTGLPTNLIQRLRDPRIRSRLLSHLEEVETGDKAAPTVSEVVPRTDTQKGGSVSCGESLQVKIPEVPQLIMPAVQPVEDVEKPEEPPDPSQVEFLVPPSDDEDEECIKRRPKKKKEVDIELMYKSPLEDLQSEARPTYGERAPRRYENFPRRRGDGRRWDDRRPRTDEPSHFGRFEDRGRDPSRDMRGFYNRPRDQSRDRRAFDVHPWPEDVPSFHPMMPHEAPHWQPKPEPFPLIFMPEPPKIDYEETRLINLELLTKTTNLESRPVPKIYNFFNKENIHAQMLHVPSPKYDPNEIPQAVKMMDPVTDEIIEIVPTPRPTSGLTKDYFRHVPPDLTLDDVVKFHFISPSYVMVHDNEEDMDSSSDGDEPVKCESLHRKQVGNKLEQRKRLSKEGEPVDDSLVSLSGNHINPLQNILQNLPLLRERFSMKIPLPPLEPPPPPEWNDVDLRLTRPLESPISPPRLKRSRSGSPFLTPQKRHSRSPSPFLAPRRRRSRSRSSSPKSDMSISPRSSSRSSDHSRRSSPKRHSSSISPSRKHRR